MSATDNEQKLLNTNLSKIIIHNWEILHLSEQITELKHSLRDVWVRLWLEAEQSSGVTVAPEFFLQELSHLGVTAGEEQV